MWNLVLVCGTLREMLNKPKNCTDRPKTREIRATAQKFLFLSNPAIDAIVLQAINFIAAAANRWPHDSTAAAVVRADGAGASVDVAA